MQPPRTTPDCATRLFWETLLSDSEKSLILLTGALLENHAKLTKPPQRILGNPFPASENRLILLTGVVVKSLGNLTKPAKNDLGILFTHLEEKIDLADRRGT